MAARSANGVALGREPFVLKFGDGGWFMLTYTFPLPNAGLIWLEVTRAEGDAAGPANDSAFGIIGLSNGTTDGHIMMTSFDAGAVHARASTPVLTVARDALPARTHGYGFVNAYIDPEEAAATNGTGAVQVLVFATPGPGDAWFTTWVDGAVNVTMSAMHGHIAGVQALRDFRVTGAAVDARVAAAEPGVTFTAEWVLQSPCGITAYVNGADIGGANAARYGFTIGDMNVTSTTANVGVAAAAVRPDGPHVGYSAPMFTRPDTVARFWVEALASAESHGRFLVLYVGTSAAGAQDGVC